MPVRIPVLDGSSSKIAFLCDYCPHRRSGGTTGVASGRGLLWDVSPGKSGYLDLGCWSKAFCACGSLASVRFSVDSITRARKGMLSAQRRENHTISRATVLQKQRHAGFAGFVRYATAVQGNRSNSPAIQASRSFCSFSGMTD